MGNSFANIKQTLWKREKYIAIIGVSGSGSTTYLEHLGLSNIISLSQSDFAMKPWHFNQEPSPYLILVGE